MSIPSPKRRMLFVIVGMTIIVFFLGYYATKSDLHIPQEIDFNFHIRPILSNNCFLCHGPDPSSREADLRLDTEEGAKAWLKNGNQVIAPNNWHKSELIKRVTSDDPDFQMPPPEMKKKLSKREVALLKKWIEQGAEWKDWWAFIPPKKDHIPNEDSNSFIDYFINKKLTEKGLKPANIATKNSLIRRLSYTITGLPPTPDEIENYLKDESPNAYEKLVDRLLESPHFGERWARHWMDLVRYAETRGHEFDYPILGAWRYRDYLIRAFNEDVPYDQFIREHLAGDLLERPRFHPVEDFNESIHGTAHFALSEGTHSPVDIRKDEADRIDNMIDVTSKTFQGLTVACARCHDHKFDPIPTADYYSLYGIFESTRFSLVPAQTGKQALEKIDSIETLKNQIRAFVFGNNEKDSRPLNKRFEPESNPSISQSDSSKTAQILADFRNGTLNNWQSSGIAFGQINTFGNPIFDANSKRLVGLEEGKISSKIYKKGLQGAFRSPTFTIENKKLKVRASGKNSTIRVVIDNFQLIQNPIYGGLQKQVQNEEFRDYIFDLSMWKGHKAYVEILNGQYIAINGKQHHFDIPNDAWIEAKYVVTFDSIPPEMGYLKPNRVQSKSVAKIWNLIETKNRLSRELRDSTFFVGVTDGDAILSPVFIRGSHQNLDSEKVPHRFFTALDAFKPEIAQKGSGRLDLANAIASDQNPLTARVMINRIWHHLFGRGIIKTVDNFGLQSSPPTHPELLDYLAIDFIENDWSIKKIIRKIVLSNTFKGEVKASEKSQKIDPENLCLQHFPVRRLEAEAIRDGILATSGRIDKTMYGESITTHLTDFMKGRGRPKSGPIDGEGRRSIYQSVLRNFLSPMLLTFDMPMPFSTFGCRNVSNVPAQSLTLMNDPFVAEQAEYWAKKVLAKKVNFDKRIKLIYEKAFSRMPSPSEIQEAKNFFQDQKNTYEIESNWEANLELWSDYCHSIFMMKEFIYLI